MKQVFGDFFRAEKEQEYMVIQFSPASIPIQQRWRNNGLSADFLAEYWATFLPVCNIPDRHYLNEIKGTISYIANELLENVMKFNYEPVGTPVGLELYLYHDVFRFYSYNAMDPRHVAGFQRRIQTLLTDDSEALYLDQLEQNALAVEHVGSQMGFLTMVHDYGARLAWEFEIFADQPEHVMVTTMVEVRI